MGRSITSISGTQSNQFGTQTAQISSAAGFDAGELIYNAAGTYGTVSNTAVATATFPLSGSIGRAPAALSGGYVEVVEANNVGSLNSKNAAKLSNGNVVVVWMQGSYSPRTASSVYFKITNSSNVEVVPPTLIDSAADPAFSIASVAALTGGGFAVAWRKANFVNYAVYSNTGTVVAASATQSITQTTTAPTTMVVGTTNGGFVVAYWNTTSTVRMDFFNATATFLGAASYNPPSTSLTPYPLGLAARQVGAVHQVCVVTNSGVSAYSYGIYDATTGTSIASSSFSATSASAGTTGIDICTNSTNNDFVIPYLHVSATTLSYRTINTSNTLSGENIITSSGSFFPQLVTQALSSGGFALLVGDSVYRPLINIFNGTYVRQTPSNITCLGIVNAASPMSSFIELGNKLHIYGCTVPGTAGSQNFSNGTYLGFLFRYCVNLTTYTQDIPSATVPTGTLANSTALAVSGYAKANSTPSTASFFAASSGAISATIPQTTGSSNFISTQSVIESGFVSDTLDCDTLANGNIVVVYKNSTTVKYAVYTPTGALVSIATVGTGVIGAYQLAAVAALPNGKFVITYYSSTSTLSYAVYSSSYSLIASGSLATVSLGSPSTTQTYAMCGLTTNRFAIHYINAGGGHTVQVYDDTGTLIQTLANTLQSAGSSSPKIAGRPDGGMFIGMYHSSNNHFVATIYPTSSTTYVNVNNQNVGTSFSTLTNSIVSTSDGRMLVAFGSSGNMLYYLYNITVSNTMDNRSVSGGNNTTGQANVTVNGYGVPVAYFQVGDLETTERGFYMNNTNTSLIVPSKYTTGQWGLVVMTPANNGAYAIVMLNSSGNPTISIVTSQADTFTGSVTAGVTASNGITLSPFDNNHYFVGVSLTPCPAGGVGTVQTNGAAQLNSNYSASTPAQYFDFDINPAVPGVKGSISGRTVTMTRN